LLASIDRGIANCIYFRPRWMYKKSQMNFCVKNSVIAITIPLKWRSLQTEEDIFHREDGICVREGHD